jgi:hypothetical protein
VAIGNPSLGHCIDHATCEELLSMPIAVLRFDGNSGQFLGFAKFAMKLSQNWYWADRPFLEMKHVPITDLFLVLRG